MTREKGKENTVCKTTTVGALVDILRTDYYPELVITSCDLYICGKFRYGRKVSDNTVAGLIKRLGRMRKNTVIERFAINIIDKTLQWEKRIEFNINI